MSVAIQLITILSVLGLTYVFFRAFGPQREKLLVSHAEKLAWDQQLKGKLGGWVTVSSIVGTITSFASTLFFLGATKFFGWWSMACTITIFLGAYVTNWFTERIISLPHLKKIFASNEQSAGVIATLFWSDDKDGKKLSLVVKYLSMFCIAAVIWLEFDLMTQFASYLLGVEGKAMRVGIIFISALSVVYFTLKYGIRGFVFADLLHSPLIVIGAIGLLIGAVLLYSKLNAQAAGTFWSLGSPMLSWQHCVMFACHVTVINFLQILTTEPHWMRMWVLKDKVIPLQAKSMGVTAVLWLVMLFHGFLAFVLTQKVGDAAIVQSVNMMSIVNPIFLVLFWLAAIGALFSTADSQTYSFLLVQQFNVTTGRLKERVLANMRPGVMALIVAGGFASVYALLMDLPTTKVIFAIMPTCINLAPPFILLALRRKPSAKVVFWSLAFYIPVCLISLFRPPTEFYWSLGGLFIPLIVTLFAIPTCPKLKIESTT